MKRFSGWKALLLGLCVAAMSFPVPSRAQNRDKEKMMWRGFIMMEAIENNQVRITFMRKSHMDAAKGIQQAIAKCGADTECLAKVYDQFKGALEDEDKSFPIKMVVQFLPFCRGIIGTSSRRTSGMNCKSQNRVERDDAREIEAVLCRPMMFEVDGTYTRDKEGDRITAYFTESYPIEQHARCTVHLSNGPPEVRIYRITEDAPPKDITDKEEKVLVGEKIRLQGEVVGTGLGEEKKKKWEVPGHIIKNWTASVKETKLDGFDDDEDFEGGFLGFAWVDGSFGGARRTVKYRAEYAGAKLKGETGFRVYKPRVEWRKKELSQKVLVGLYKGDCEMRPKIPGIQLEARVTLPDDKADVQNCIQFVQLVSTDAWLLARETPGYVWFRQSFEGILDTTYPYTGPACGGKTTLLGMADSPGDPLANVNSAFDDSRFKSYLMFRPGTNDRKSLWVPLKLIDWGWKGSVTHEKTVYHEEGLVCGDRYRVICDRPPNVYDPSETDSPEHPSWNAHYDEDDMKPSALWETYTEDPRVQPPGDNGSFGWECGE